MTAGAPSPENTGHLHPEVVEHGTLSNALDAALRDIGSPLLAAHWEPLPTPRSEARVERGARNTSITATRGERILSLTFRSDGIWLANGTCDDIRDAARVIDLWIVGGVSCPELRDSAPWVNLGDLAEAFERGEEVEHRWRMYLVDNGKRDDELAFIIAASEQPRLRALRPYISMMEIRFSRSTGYPFSRDTPYVIPAGEGRYRVFAPDGTPIGIGTAEEAVAMVVAGLPPGCGPAVRGTTESLGLD